MRILLMKPLPQPELSRVVPAGAVIDAPPGLTARLLREGIGEIVPPEAPAPAPAPASVSEARAASRKRVKRHG